MDKCIYSAEMIDNILKEMADVEINQRKAVRRNETFYIGRKIPSDKAN